VVVLVLVLVELELVAAPEVGVEGGRGFEVGAEGGPGFEVGVDVVDAAGWPPQAAATMATTLSAATAARFPR
jgi:hypothetical protein